MDFLISPKSLKEKLESNAENLIIVDLRFNLSNPNAGKEAYDEEHLPGAVYVDLDKDLSSIPAEHGGRHPLPNVDDFSKRLGELGIDNDTEVIVYDGQAGVFASRFWWMMKHIGHENVAILNGGIKKWAEEGYPLTAEVENHLSKKYIPQNSDEWQKVDAATVKEKLNDSNTIMIDARDKKRYLGLTETVDPVGGHIPGAISLFWKNVITKDGTWKDEKELEEVFANIPRTKEVIVYCGSGVSACPNIFALKRAGYENVKLYPGSWSDWITHEGYPIATEETK